MRSIYGSNGLAAGNTPEEALTQGLSEIFERYVMRELYYKNITPPIISDSYLLKEFADEYKLIKLIEKTNRFKITIRDCSLAKGLPVIGLSFIDYKKNTCYVRFGADPDLKIALQRCITELFQGMTLTGLEKMTAFSLDDEDLVSNHINYNDLCCTGSARFSNSFFLSTPSYKFAGFQHNEFSSLRDKLIFSLKIVKKLGYNDIYVRDFSFLNFPAYQIIIPGLSECFSIPPVLKNVMANKCSSLDFLNNISHLNENQLLLFANSIENYKNYEKGGRTHIFLSEYIKNLISSDKWKNITLEFFLALIYFKIRNYRKAYENISIFITLLEKLNIDSHIEYYYCVRLYFALLMQNIKKSDIENTLKNIFCSDIVTAVISDLDYETDIFKYIPLPKLWDCKNCLLKDDCKYDTLSAFYLNLKKAQLGANINQLSLRQFFYNH